MFTSSAYEAAVPETVAIGTSVLQVLATDSDSGKNAKIAYSIISGNNDNILDIDTDLGYIFVANALSVRIQPEFHLVVKATDYGEPPLTNYSLVHLTVTVPDNVPPRFEKNLYVFDVPEDVKPGQVIVSGVRAFTKQSLFYQLQASEEEKDHFAINVNSGEVFVRKELDYEEKQRYEFRVIATNLVGANDTAHVIINIIDANDNAPEFAQDKFSAKVFEDMKIGAEVARVTAADKDSGYNAQIRYHILSGRRSGNEGNTFAIQSETGIVTLAKPLDYESTKEYNLVIKAEDRGTPPLFAETHLHVVVSDSNDNAPQFFLSSYQANVKEDAPVNDRIIQVAAFDKDSDVNGHLTYHFRTSDDERGSRYKEFAMDSRTGIIYIADPLDREMTSSYIMEVVCSDNGSPAMTSSVLVTLEISDVNDNPPTFGQSNYTVFVKENKDIGATLITFNITDADGPTNSLPFRLEIADGNDDDVFAIGSDLSLKVFRRMNSSRQSLYELELTVSDSGSPSLSSKAFVTIHVIGEPRYPPVLAGPVSVAVNSFLDLFPGGVIAKLRASDNDPFDNLTFGIVDAIDRQLFSINAADGTVNALPGLDVGSYRVNVSVTDGKFTSFTNIDVEVALISEDAIDNSVQLKIGSVTPEDFLVSHKTPFLRALRNTLNVRMKDVLIISTQQASDLKRDRRSPNSKNDLIVVISVYKVSPAKTVSGPTFFSSSWLTEKLVENKNAIEKQMGLQVIEIMRNSCDDLDGLSCQNGQCEDEITLDETKVTSVTTDKMSLVAPLQSRRVYCSCKPGFGGKLCDTVVNECGRTPSPCPAFKECVPISSTLGYVCNCPFGKTGEACNQNAKSCLNQKDVSLCYHEVNPISFQGTSYARYTLTKSNIEKISLRLRTTQSKANIMFSSGSKDYSVLEISSGFVQFKFDLGSGEGLIRVIDLPVHDGKWHEVVVERKGNSATITLDGKYRAGGQAPGVSDTLNLEGSDLYFGAQVKPVAVGSGGEETIQFGFSGCLDSIRLNDKMLPLHLTATSPVAALKRLANVEFGACGVKERLFIDPCDAKVSPCSNGGKCLPNILNGSFECICMSSRYTGAKCEVDTNPCAGRPCVNDGVCSNVPLEQCEDKVNGGCYKCECEADFLGANCERAKYCDYESCAKNGECQETSDGVVCLCKQGYHGDRCELDIDECTLPTPVCQAPATCLNIPGSFRCICPYITSSNGTLSPCSGDHLYTTRITSSAWNVTLDELIILLIILVVLLISCCCLSLFWRFTNKSRRNRTPASAYRGFDANELLLKNPKFNTNEMNVNLKRFSKLSNLESTPLGPLSSDQVHPQQVRGGPKTARPMSFHETLNNFDMVRRHNSVGEDLESVEHNQSGGATAASQDIREHFVQNFKKMGTPIVVSVSPQQAEVIANNQANSSQLKGNEGKIQNGKAAP